MQNDQRRTPRYPFIASAELIEVKSEARMSSRVSELGLNGCYLDMLNPFPTGTAILVKIFTDSDYFESRASVVYSQPNMGMGVSFQDVRPQFVAVLQKWLLEAMRKKQQS